jgi:hypothetical protein
MVLVRAHILHSSPYHPAGSSAAPGSDVIKTIRDSKTDFSTMVYIINAGCDFQFWQVRQPQRNRPHSQEGGAGLGLHAAVTQQTEFINNSAAQQPE